MQALLDILVKSKASILAEEQQRDYGICRVIHRHLEDQSEDFYWSDIVGTLHGLFKDWPEFSGDEDYPVDHPDYNDPGDAFEGLDDLWVGEYGAARMRLLDWMIEELQGRGYVTTT